jgi:hypothetical protein
MDLELEFTYEAEMGEGQVVGSGPYGTRMVIPVSGGWVKGARINGTVTSGGGDWALIGPDGWARFDVRGQIQTDDGAVLYLTYGGVLQLTEKVMAATGSAGETSFGDQYFRTTPCLESGDERYAWVNQTVFVARGRMSAKGVEYEVYRVT